MSKPPFRLMIDSGAFTAKTKGHVVDRNEYLEYLQENEGKYEIAINLDVIPGKLAGQASYDELHDAAKQSLRNYKFLKKNGINVIPVYHYNEPISYLHDILDTGATYIALGGAAKLPIARRLAWLDKVFCHVDTTKIKVHGLALTSLKVILRYPFYSADSTSPIILGATGDIALFRASTFAQIIHWRNLDAQPQSTKNLMSRDMEILGFELDDLKKNVPRCAFNVYQFLKVLNVARPVFKRSSLFNNLHSASLKQACRKPCVLYMGINGVRALGIMSRFCNSYLISFAYRNSFNMDRLKQVYESAAPLPVLV